MFRNQISSFLKNVSRIIDPINGPLVKLAEQPRLPYLTSYYSYRAIFKDIYGKELYGLGTDENIEKAVVKATAEGIEKLSLVEISKGFRNSIPLEEPHLSTSEFIRLRTSCKTGWLKGWDECSRNIWIPFDINSFCITTSGTASHFDFNTALSKALLELIERDAFLVRWLSASSPALIDITTFNDSLVKKVAKNISQDGHKLFLFDLSLDIPVLVMAALIQTKDNHFCLGLGSGWDFNEAITHALIEALRYFGKLSETKVFDYDIAVEKLTSLDIEGHIEYHWSLERENSFDFMTNSPFKMSFDELLESKKWISNINELIELMNLQKKRWCYLKIENEVTADLLYVTKCVIPSLQAMYAGYTNKDVINFTRLNTLGLRWVCDTPHPLC